MSALFHKSGIVCEAGDDKVFYQAANSKLSESNNGIQDNIFLNVNGKHGIYKLVKPLREIGIPVASIYDFDVIKTDEQKNKVKTEILWQNIVSSYNIDDATSNKLKEDILKIDQELTELNSKQNNLNIFKYFKRDLVSPDLLSSIDSFLEQLSEYGLFIVPVGELESWLPNYPKNEEWLTNGLNWIDAEKNIITIKNGSIWNFILKIKAWIENENREGMPINN